MKDIVSPPVRGAEKPYGKEWEKHAMRRPKTMASVIRHQGKRIVELVRERDALQAEVVDAMNRAAAGPLPGALQGLRDRGMIDDLTMARAAERLLAEYPEHEAGHGAGSVTDKEAAGDPGRYAPVTLDLKWVKDDDGTILRWADITDYDVCGTAPHEPRNYILRLADNAEPRGKRLHNIANWAGWRKAIREIPINDMREWTVGRTRRDTALCNALPPCDTRGRGGGGVHVSERD